MMVLLGDAVCTRVYNAVKAMELILFKTPCEVLYYPEVQYLVPVRSYQQ